MNITNKQIYDKASEISSEFGNENLEGFLNETREGLNAGGARAMRAKERAADFLQKLIHLTLYQILEPEANIDRKRHFANLFDDGKIEQGNQKQYINPLATGNDEFANIEDSFVPTTITSPQIESAYIRMYSDRGVLDENAYKYVKYQTIREPEWIPYFKSGTLTEFIRRIQELIYKSWELFKFHKITKFILSESEKFKKQVNGSGADMFESINEVLYNIANMKNYNSEYNLGNSVDCRETDLSNIIVLMSTKNKQLISSGIKTQLFNAHLLNLDGIIDNSNIYELGNQLDIKTVNDYVEVTGTPYIDDNTIIVFDKRAFRMLYQLEQPVSQNFANNLTIQVYLHVWGCYGMLPWYQGFVYKNNNLSKLPSSNALLSVERTRNK